jgi:hypothetical protein
MLLALAPGGEVEMDNEIITIMPNVQTCTAANKSTSTTFNIVQQSTSIGKK